MFSGCYTALVTPWTEDGGALDVEKLRELIELQIEGGVAGVLPGGTTGESATLSHEEHRALVRHTVEIVNGRCKVLAGAGSNNTAEAVALARYAAEVGADAALVITPYYNKPTPEGQFRHFRTVAEACGIPVMLYNVPGRTGTNTSAATVARTFREVENVVAVKEASGDLSQICALRELCAIDIMSGEDGLTFPILCVGGQGVVSVVSNIAPAAMQALCDAATEGDLAKARELHYKLLPVVRACFLENNPMCVKTALRLLGRYGGAVRSPLCEVSPATEKAIGTALRGFGLTPA